jgi:YVTN family beta-propeller protein
MIRLLRRSAQAAVVGVACCLACGCGSAAKEGATGSGDGGLPEGSCALPTAAALVPVGAVDGGRILPGGRKLTPAGIEAPLGGFPVDVRVHPTLPVAYVMNTGYALRAVQVVDTNTGALLQTITRPECFYGMALSADATRLYTAGGFAGTVDVWDVGADGTLTADSQIPVPMPANGAANPYPAGIALSPDGTKLWVGEFLGEQIDEVDLASSTVTTSIPLKARAYSLLYVPAQDQLWVSGFGSTDLTVIDLSMDQILDTVAIGPNPSALALSPDGSKVFVSITDGDVVVAVDVATRAVVASQSLGDPEIASADGKPLPADSPSGLLLDPGGQKLYVVRAADNAVSILDAATLAPQASVPVGWYPTSVAVTGTKLVVLNAKGFGAGPLTAAEADPSQGKAMMNGSVSLVDLATANLPALTAQVLANVERPSTLFPFDCPGFPVPTRPGDKSPIEHVVLIVRENKTYDTLLGDLGEKDANGEPSLVLFGQDVTPNLHALALQFAHHDNFYDDSETSTQGHLWLSSSFVNDYIERTWLEDYRNHPGFSNDPDEMYGEPAFGTFFTHLIAGNVDFTDYGEVTGVLQPGVLSHVDTSFPGTFFDLTVLDQEKATYVAGQIVNKGILKPFTYVLLPNDHTNGTTPGSPTPEAMIADNDAATGLLVDQITHSKWWSSTAIFLVEDDAQIGADHVDYHRSICVVMSPWVKHGYVSHVHTSLPSLFRTFEQILGLPSMNRYDALAPALFDVFTTQPDETPFDAVTVSPGILNMINPPSAAGASYSALMDFRGPDRNADLGDVLVWERTGAPPPGSRIASEIAKGLPPGVAPGDDDDGRQQAIYEAGWNALYDYLDAHPDIHADLRPQPAAPGRASGSADPD